MGEWRYEFPGWMAGREDKIKNWYEDTVHPNGAVGFMLAHRIGRTGVVLEEAFDYDPASGWT